MDMRPQDWELLERVRQLAAADGWWFGDGDERVWSGGGWRSGAWSSWWSRRPAVTTVGRCG
ncbi:hypothetical protein ACWGCW_39410 [Streptomyces sp. NPDC054933]